MGEALFLSAYKSGLAATSWDLPSSWNIILCVIVPFLPVLMYISDTIALRYATVHERIGETEVRGRTEGEGMWERERNLLIFAMTQAGGLWGGAFVRVARYDIMSVESRETGSFHQVSLDLTHKAAVMCYGSHFCEARSILSAVTVEDIDVSLVSRLFLVRVGRRPEGHHAWCILFLVLLQGVLDDGGGAAGA